MYRHIARKLFKEEHIPASGELQVTRDAENTASLRASARQSRRRASPTAHSVLHTEVAVSRRKLHTRGRMASQELTTYNWVVAGEGHVPTQESWAAEEDLMQIRELHVPDELLRSKGKAELEALAESPTHHDFDAGTGSGAGTEAERPGAE